MCLIIVATPTKIQSLLDNTPFLDSVLQWNNNGVGVMAYAPKSRLPLTWRKEISSVSGIEMLKKFVQKYAYAESIAIHFRMRTHGDTTINNVHPFVSSHAKNDKVVLMHNGILRPFCLEATGEASDTKLFVENVINKLPTESIFHREILERLEILITKDNTMVLAHEEFGFRILNQDIGFMHNDVWFSNAYAFNLSTLSIRRIKIDSRENMLAHRAYPF